jgi:hypothetical protein
MAYCMVLISLVSCSSARMSELETEQDQLKREIRQLKQAVGDFKREMSRVGLVEARDGAENGTDEVGNPSPNEDITPALNIQSSRTGAPPTLPSLAKPKRSSTLCGYRYDLPQIRDISDFSLNKAGFGKSSPVLLLEDGQPLTAHAFPNHYEQNCSGAFRHAGTVLLFSPTDNAQKAIQSQYSLHLDGSLPMTRPDGREIYWVYPNTTLTFVVDGLFDPAWGEGDVDIAGALFGSGQPLITVDISGTSKEINEDRFTVHSEMPNTKNSWTIQITSPERGPFVLIDLQTIRNMD